MRIGSIPADLMRIWVIHETTITFENIQNVRLSQGPIERYFGFANLTVETAGGGSAHAESGGLSTCASWRHGRHRQRRNYDQIIFKIQECRSAGLGDEQLRG
ncbi:MAG: PH domain-containing protein [Pirellulaceae bacterium]